MPAPRPVQVDYTPLGMVGLLAQRIGENNRFNTRHAQGQQVINDTRQYQLAQRDQEFRHAFAMQQAYANRGGGGSGRTGVQTFTNQPPPVQPAQLQLQQVNAELQAMTQRGTIDPEHADRIRLGAMGVPASLAALGVDPEETNQGLSPQERRLRADFQLDAEIGALEQERRLAQGEADAYLDSLGGVIATSKERKTYEQFTDRVAEARRQQAAVYQRFSGALPGGGGGTVTDTPPAAPPQIPPGTPTATGPDGQKVAYINGQWVPIQ